MPDASDPTAHDPTEWDYIVVGSGAGGGVVAARLAELGHSVLLLEAGGDPRDEAGDRMPDDYDVPGFHPFASENPGLAWDFWVEHYADPAQQALDPKRQPQGILYPRATGLGGCTAHNAMILIYPDAVDWKHIEAITGDASWSSKRMRHWFKMIEDCRHRPWLRFLKNFGIDYSGHGWNGWLTTEEAEPKQAFSPEIFHLLADSAQAAMMGAPRAIAALARFLLGRADPNDRSQAVGRSIKLWYTPLATRKHHRTGARERVLCVRKRLPEKLTVKTNALVTRVSFDDQRRATGVECLMGKGLYRASKEPTDAPGDQASFRARREVVLAGGAFNTPQLLMLSGIGPSQTLAAHDIPVVVDLPGVGRNLQDRYEVGVVNRMAKNWSVLDGARFERGDRLWQEWAQPCPQGLYVSNGAVLAAARRASHSSGPRDLFFMALLAKFRGYEPGYSKVIAEHHDYLTWTVLKSHTTNRAGVVTLKSADPRDPPTVDFHYFDPSSGDAAADLNAVVEGVRFARRLAKPLRDCGMIVEEEEPGETVRTKDEIARYVRDKAWGHHASCTCPIGRREEGGVVDGDFRVHGVTGLRIVDASVFPRIPGSFIACAIYMIAEKAAHVIHDAATGETRP